MPSLREQLIGVWRLVSYQELPVDGGPVRLPLGAAPLGQIMYTPDGFMSAQVMQPERRAPVGGDWLAATPAEYAAAARGYIAYCGRFAVDEAGRTVTHIMTLALNPGWVGNAQPRSIALPAQGRLQLGSVTPFRAGGVMVMSRIDWECATGL